MQEIETEEGLRRASAEGLVSPDLPLKTTLALSEQHEAPWERKLPTAAPVPGASDACWAALGGVATLVSGPRFWAGEHAILRGGDAAGRLGRLHKLGLDGGGVDPLVVEELLHPLSHGHVLGQVEAANLPHSNNSGALGICNTDLNLEDSTISIPLTII